MEHTRFLTERELASTLRCSVAAVRVWRTQGMPARRFGRLVRFELGPVLEWFEKRDVATLEVREAAP
jgi:phage terminase Nu1 subunit (DNA packaging protein)